jgi:hypothetical protein
LNFEFKLGLAKIFLGFSSVQAEIPRELMAWLGAFIWVLAHKEKNADTTSETKSQTEQKGFSGFC